MGTPGTEASALRKAIVLFLACAACVGLRFWSAPAHVPSLSATRQPPQQRLTPVDAPRFKAGEWIDQEGRPLVGGDER